MSARKTNPGKWSEEDVESLLVDFFQHEMPRDLPRLASSHTLGTRSVLSQSDRERRSAGYKGIGVAACVLLLAVTALSPSGQRLLPPSPSVGKTDSDIGDLSTVTVKPSTRKNASAVSFAKKDRPPPELHPAILDVLPPELRHPFDNFSPVRPEGDGLDIRDLLDIEILRPFSPVTPPNDKQPRLPEERE